jgi:hypothetical protein
VVVVVVAAAAEAAVAAASRLAGRAGHRVVLPHRDQKLKPYSTLKPHSAAAAAAGEPCLR